MTTATSTRRTASWIGTGIDIREARSVQEAIKISGLDYEVVKAPLYLSNGYKIPGKFATKKKGTDEVFGVVGNDFTVVQNEDAFDFVNGIIGEGLRFEKAGEIGGMNYIIASLPDQYILGDRMTPYIIFQNSHNGSSPLRCSISPLRIVCQNQFTMEFRKSDNKISIRHTASIVDKMKEAERVLGFVADHMKVFESEASSLALQKVSESDVAKIVDLIFPVDENASTRKQNSASENKARFIAAYEEEDLFDFRGTKWGLVNAYSDFITHKKIGRKTEKAEANRFVQVTLNPVFMERFMSVIDQF